MTTKIEPNELEALIDAELESHHEELMAPSKSVATVADSLPGLGIVAAVLGIVLTMGKMNEPPAVLGQSIGAALVGTFLGVLLCYGFVGPMAKNMEVLGLGGAPVPHGAQDGHRGLRQRRRTAGGRRVRPAGRPGSRQARVYGS